MVASLLRWHPLQQVLAGMGRSENIFFSFQHSQSFWIAAKLHETISLQDCLTDRAVSRPAAARDNKISWAYTKPSTQAETPF